MSFLEFIVAHQGTIISVLVAFVGFLKLTSWGKAKSEALDAIVGVIETLSIDEAKHQIAAESGKISQGASDAIEHAVNKVDTKKRPKPVGERLAGELLRGILRKV